MLDIKFIRENPEKVKEGARRKGVKVDVDELLRLDSRRREKITEIDRLRARQNAISGEVAKLSGGERAAKIAETQKLKAALSKLEFERKPLEEEFGRMLRKMPNLPYDDVPVGGEKASVVLREVGGKPQFKFKPRDYLEIAEGLDLIDTGRAAKVSGSRFGYLKREAALLEFALVRLALDFLTDSKNVAGIVKKEKLGVKADAFVPVVPPVLIKPESMAGMGYVERGGEEIYFIEKDKLYLVGTSEQSVGPMHMDETFEEKDLPLRYVSFSSCFRREAGSYGKDTRGILRVHQFDKVEMFVLSTPETSRQEHNLLRAIEEGFLQVLSIPYRLLNHATLELGDPAAAKFDLEAWLPGQKGGEGEYREVTSTSDTTSFQARRLNIKVRRKDGKTEFLHMVNGTAFAAGRMIIAILENCQQKNGSVKIPKALRPYMHGLREIRRK